MGSTSHSTVKEQFSKTSTGGVERSVQQSAKEESRFVDSKARVEKNNELEKASKISSTKQKKEEILKTDDKAAINLRAARQQTASPMEGSKPKTNIINASEIDEWRRDKQQQLKEW